MKSNRLVYMPADKKQLIPIKKIEEIAFKYNIPLGAIALQFSLKESKISSTICGISKPEHLKQTINWAKTNIPKSIWDEITKLGTSYEDPEINRIYKPN